MESITLKKGSPLLIPVVFKKTVVLNTTIDRQQLEQLLNAEFTEPVTLVQPQLIVPE